MTTAELSFRVAERPAGACCLCRPPRYPQAGPQVWTQASGRSATCDDCYDRLRDKLAEVAKRFLLTDPRPGGNRIPGMRGAPGFGSRSPASDHVIAMRDVRSSDIAKVWVGGDGRVHEESSRPACNVHGTLSLLAWSIAEHRDVSGPDDRDDVYALLRFVDRHIAYVTRYAELALEADRALRDLVARLRPVTGDGRRWIGKCPNVLTDPELLEALESDEPVRCNADLFAPCLSDPTDTIQCAACGAEWPRDKWLSLGNQLNAEVLRALC